MQSSWWPHFAQANLILQALTLWTARTGPASRKAIGHARHSGHPISTGFRRMAFPFASSPARSLPSFGQRS